MADAATSVAFAWAIERRDGVAIGLTDHDRDLVVDGFAYRAAPGMVPSAIARSDGLDAEAMEVAGALDARAIGERDLLAGRWDGARVMASAVDWASGVVVARLGEGSIGAVELSERGFTAELRGVAAGLERGVAEETSPTCRASLGDRRCRVAMAGRRRLARVVASEGAVLTLDRAEPVAGAYAEGRLAWIGGENGGLASAVATSDGVSVTLEAAPAFAVAAGTLVELSEGCDRRIETCAGRFANAANFRGEPFLPGIDLLTRYPGG